jgi:hypothetical protein
VRQAEVERRMMLEQKHRAILWGPPQAVFKEGKTLVTKLAGMGRRAFVERTIVIRVAASSVRTD